jgi:hypothetical protein
LLQLFSAASTSHGDPALLDAAAVHAVQNRAVAAVSFNEAAHGALLALVRKAALAAASLGVQLAAVLALRLLHAADAAEVAGTDDGAVAALTGGSVQLAITFALCSLNSAFAAEFTLEGRLACALASGRVQNTTILALGGLCFARAANVAIVTVVIASDTFAKGHVESAFLTVILRELALVALGAHPTPDTVLALAKRLVERTLATTGCLGLNAFLAAITAHARGAVVALASLHVHCTAVAIRVGSGTHITQGTSPREWTRLTATCLRSACALVHADLLGRPGLGAAACLASGASPGRVSATVACTSTTVQCATIFAILLG